MTSEGSAGSTTQSTRYVENLERDLRITYGVRFGSVTRLEKKHQLSTLAVSVLSLYVIATEVLALTVKAKTPTMDILFPLGTIVAPIFIIILSHHEAGKQYLVLAERMHRSAQRIQTLHSRLQSLRKEGDAPPEQVEKISNRYAAILQDFSASHDTVDYHHYQAMHPQMFTEKDKSFGRRANLQVRGRLPYYVNVWAVPLACILLPLAIIVVALWSVLMAKAENTPSGTGRAPAAWVSRSAIWAAAAEGQPQPAIGRHPPSGRRGSLCRAAGGELEQIQVLLGHASLPTAARYLGSWQETAIAVIDPLGIPLGAPRERTRQTAWEQAELERRQRLRSAIRL